MTDDGQDVCKECGSVEQMTDGVCQYCETCSKCGATADGHRVAVAYGGMDVDIATCDCEEEGDVGRTNDMIIAGLRERGENEAADRLQFYAEKDWMPGRFRFSGLKRYLVFSGVEYYPSGGIWDFDNDFDTREEATDRVAALGTAYRDGWTQIVDTWAKDRDGWDS